MAIALSLPKSHLKMGEGIRPNRINIDTGAYATGRLTCLVLEGDHMSFI